MNDREVIDAPPGTRCPDDAVSPPRREQTKKRAPPATFTVSVTLDRVKATRTPNPAGGTITTYESFLTVEVRRLNQPTAGADVTLTDMVNPATPITGTTGADGKFTATLPVAVDKLTFDVDFRGINLVNGTGTVKYSVTGVRAPNPAVTLTFGATLTTTAVSQAGNVDFLSKTGLLAPFEGAESTIVNGASGFTNADGKFSATPTTTTRTRAGIRWIDSAKAVQSQTITVP
jgi:hypothetical protein